MIVTANQVLRLKDLCSVKIGDPNADFWITRRNSIDKVGLPTKEFNPQHIGITVQRPDILDANYLYYMMQYIHQQGYWRQCAKGTTKLVGITTSDVANIQFQT